MVQLLLDNPLLLLFAVAAVGVPLGRLPLGGGSRLGVAAVLFSGLAFGALDPELQLPSIVYLLGLVLFIYPVGLSSGPAFFAAFRRKGLRDNVLVAGVLGLAALAAAGLGRLLALDAPLTAGLFAGALTNTPALAAVLEALERGAPGAGPEVLNAPVVGYSIAYPVGVLGVIVAIALAQRLWRVDYAAEAERLADLGATPAELESRTVEVTRTEYHGRRLGEVIRAEGWDVVFSRLETEHGVELPGPDSVLAFGQRVTAVGRPEALDVVERTLGRPAEEALDVDRSALDQRRIFVSSREAAGRTLRRLRLPQRFGAVVTRVRRGDVELMPHADMVLELGDRVRVVAPRHRLAEVSRFFGDSYHALSQVNVLTFSLGITLGMLVGLVAVPAGDVQIQLGMAGGPLVVGLVLGARGFTGPLVWTMPYSANQTLRQIGLVLFFAGVGTRAGWAFVDMLGRPSGLALLAAGAGVTCGTALLALWVGHRVLKIPMSLLTGMLAGLQTQPAVLGYATEQTGNDVPNVGYATVFPTATVVKLILAQVLLALG